MPHDILAGQVAECDVLNLSQYIHRHFKAALRLKGKILLGQVSCDDDL